MVALLQSEKLAAIFNMYIIDMERYSWHTILWKQQIPHYYVNNVLFVFTKNKYIFAKEIIYNKCLSLSGVILGDWVLFVLIIGIFIFFYNERYSLYDF